MISRNGSAHKTEIITNQKVIYYVGVNDGGVSDNSSSWCWQVWSYPQQQANLWLSLFFIFVSQTQILQNNCQPMVAPCVKHVILPLAPS